MSLLEPSELIESDIVGATPTRVRVLTRTLNLEGEIYVPKVGKSDRRLTRLLQSDRKFLPMTNVQIMDRGLGARTSELCPFLEVSIANIEIIQPLDGEA